MSAPADLAESTAGLVAARAGASFRSIEWALTRIASGACLLGRSAIAALARSALCALLERERSITPRRVTAFSHGRVDAVTLLGIRRALLADREPLECAQAIDAIVALGDLCGIALGLAANDSYVRQCAVRALGDLPDATFSSLLRSRQWWRAWVETGLLLTQFDPAVEVREALPHALSRRFGRLAVWSLIRLTRDEQNPISLRLSSLYALDSHFRRREVRYFLRTVAGSNGRRFYERPLRETAAALLTRRGSS